MINAFVQATLLSLLLGSVIGLERQWHRRLLDLKTNALVSLGACLFMLVTHIGTEFHDFVRMAGQIVVGVGFIGGGLLFREGAQTRGINTAATLWCCAAVGILCGIDRGAEAAIATFTIVVANTLLRQIAQFLNLKMGASDSLTETVQIHLKCTKQDLPRVQNHITASLQALHIELKAATSESLDPELVHLSYTLLMEHGQYSQAGTNLLQTLQPPEVLSFSWSLMS
jgi:putative Mg2+ transporter-C (MgtC) family protein